MEAASENSPGQGTLDSCCWQPVPRRGDRHKSVSTAALHNVTYLTGINSSNSFLHGNPYFSCIINIDRIHMGHANEVFGVWMLARQLVRK